MIPEFFIQPAYVVETCIECNCLIMAGEMAAYVDGEYNKSCHVDCWETKLEEFRGDI